MEFETSISASSNPAATSSKRYVYQQASTGYIVLGTFLSVLAVAAMVIILRYIILMPVSDEIIEKGNGSLVYAKICQLFENLTNGNIMGDWIGNLIAFATAPLLGLFAGLMDDALCMLPLGRSIRRHIGFHVSWYTRLAPAILFAVYMFIYLACITINPEINMVIADFSWTGEGYTKAMWFSQIFYFLIGLTFLILCIEAIANAGILGALVRIPLHFLTNMFLAIVLAAIAAVAFIAILFVFALIVTLLIFRIMAIIAILNG